MPFKPSYRNLKNSMTILFSIGLRKWQSYEYTSNWLGLTGAGQGCSSSFLGTSLDKAQALSLFGYHLWRGRDLAQVYRLCPVSGALMTDCLLCEN